MRFRPSASLILLSSDCALTRIESSLKQVPHLHPRLLQQARIHKNRSRARQRSRNPRRLPTPHQRQTRSLVRVVVRLLDVVHREKQRHWPGRGFDLHPSPFFSTFVTRYDLMTTSTLPPTPQYQVQQQALRAQNRNQTQPPINRLMNGMPPRQAVQMPPNGGGMPNGMPGGQGMPNGHMSFPMSNQPGHPPSGPGNAPGGPQQPLNMQGMMPGQRTMGQF